MPSKVAAKNSLNFFGTRIPLSPSLVACKYQRKLPIAGFVPAFHRGVVHVIVLPIKLNVSSITASMLCRAAHTGDDQLKCQWVNDCEQGRENEFSSTLANRPDNQSLHSGVFVGLENSRCACPSGWVVMSAASGCCPKRSILRSSFPPPIPDFLRSDGDDSASISCSPVCFDQRIEPPACGKANEIQVPAFTHGL